MPLTAVLVGPPASGKSAAAHLVSAALGVPLAETDDAVAQVAGMPIHDIFVLEGEQRFRDLELHASLELLRGEGIVVLGGGAVMSPQVRAALSGLPVLGLTVRAGVAISRLGMAGPRSVMMGPVHKQWTDLMAVREPFYAEVSRWQIDTSPLRPEQVARRIIELVGVDSE